MLRECVLVGIAGDGGEEDEEGEVLGEEEVEVEGAVDFGCDGRGPVCEGHVVEDGIFEHHGGLEAAFDGRHEGALRQCC